MTSPDIPTAKQVKSLWKLGGLPLSHLGHKVLNRIIENNVFGQAAALAFYFLFALFPLILIMMTLFGLFTSRSIELQNKLLSYFADFLPTDAFQLLRKPGETRERMNVIRPSRLVL